MKTADLTNPDWPTDRTESTKEENAELRPLRIGTTYSGGSLKPEHFIGRFFCLITSSLFFPRVPCVPWAIDPELFGLWKARRHTNPENSRLFA